jgi:hypothetical protein
MRRTLRSTRGRAVGIEASAGPAPQEDPLSQPQGNEDLTVTPPAASDEQTVQSVPIVGTEHEDLGDEHEIIELRGRNDQCGDVVTEGHGNVPTRRAPRDLSLDSGYQRYNVADEVQTAWQAVAETKSMVSDVNTTLQMIMRRLDYLENT